MVIVTAGFTRLLPDSAAKHITVSFCVYPLFGTQENGNFVYFQGGKESLDGPSYMSGPRIKFSTDYTGGKIQG